MGEAYSFLSENRALFPVKMFKSATFGEKKYHAKAMRKLAFWNQPKGTFPFSKKFGVRLAFARSLLQDSMKQRIKVTELSQELEYYSDAEAVRRRIQTLKDVLTRASVQNKPLLEADLAYLVERFNSQKELYEELASANKVADSKQRKADALLRKLYSNATMEKEKNFLEAYAKLNAYKSELLAELAKAKRKPAQMELDRRILLVNGRIEEMEALLKDIKVVKGQR